VLARHPEWVEEGDVPELEDEADDSQESEGADVRELFRVTPPLQEPIEDAVEEPEPESEPDKRCRRIIRRRLSI
jgi:hypothetical protein